MELNGKRAIVVGGASGMALASVELLIRNGVKVAILDLPTSRGAEEAARLGIRFYPCNVMDFAGTEGAIRNAATALGGLHIVVNTAGGGIARRTLGKDGPHPIEEFQQVVNLNLVSSFNVARIAADTGARRAEIATLRLPALDGRGCRQAGVGGSRQNAVEPALLSRAENGAVGFERRTFGKADILAAGQVVETIGLRIAILALIEH